MTIKPWTVSLFTLPMSSMLAGSSLTLPTVLLTMRVDHIPLASSRFSGGPSESWTELLCAGTALSIYPLQGFC